MSNILEVLSQNIEVDKDKCVFCARCVDACTMDNLRMKLAPCQKACPLGLNCQGYVQLIVRGNEGKALEFIGKKLPFPGILGRICHHHCESECSRNKVDGEGVALRVLKRYLSDNLELVLEDIEPEKELDEKVAIIGGGPAGIMAAFTLRTKGYQVTVYEAQNKLGGMLSGCIPEFRLPEEIVQKELSLLHNMGIEILYNTKVGKDIPFTDILNQYDAVIIAIGTQGAKKIGLTGEKSENVYDALSFLRQVRNKQEIKVGKKALVIGGGNTAIDAAQTAHRLGCEEVRVVCLESYQEMPAYKWEVADALEEGIIIEHGWGPKQFIVEDNQIRGVVFKRCLSVFDEDGNLNPKFSEDETQIFEADTVVVAIGQEVEPGLDLGSIQTNRGFIITDSVTKQTSVDKVFAAGDITIGPKSVADAMAQGREAAISVDRFLRDLPIGFDRDPFASCQLDFEVDLSKAEMIPRVCPEKLEGEERASFKELEKSITKEQALMEAKRCLSCGEPYGKYRTCWYCSPCEVECPREAIKVNKPYLIR
ncbi:MAG: FAD-dependent oxidoreductase [Clostridia bacterium]|nr:FAD-dependent oxidoreductase [Clostridia bacterium]